MNENNAVTGSQISGVPRTAEWAGAWVARRLGVRLRASEDPIGPGISTAVTERRGPYGAPTGPGAPHARGALETEELQGLVGLALRRNPRRAHLLVSTVLGKHVPQLPGVVHGAGLELGRRVGEALGDPAAAPLVIGYAETATGLGHCVAEALPGATYLHSTRRPVAGVVPVGGFEEEHSHATSHLLLPADPGLLARGGPLVLVDDELSTGRTVTNTIEAVHRVAPRDRYVIAALIDVRTPADRIATSSFADRLGVRIDVVSLASGTVTLPPDALTRGAALVAAEEARQPASRRAEPEHGPAPVVRLVLDWPPDLPEGARHGFTPAHRAVLEKALPVLGEQLATQVVGARRVLVLGCEELMYVPLRLALALADATAEPAFAHGHPEVRFSTTTRSPVLAVDDPAYAIRTRLVFPAHDDPADGPGDRFAYNIDPGGDPARRFEAIVAVVDGAADTAALHAPGGLLDELARVTDRVVLVVLPSHVPSSTRPSVPESEVVR